MKSFRPKDEPDDPDDGDGRGDANRWVDFHGEKRIEEIFGWVKEIGGMTKARFVGRWKIQLQAWATGASYNLMRLAKQAEG